ncbi:MAG: ABC transporter ATP-binding protein, partial [Mesorhizobium sp.]
MNFPKLRIKGLHKSFGTGARRTEVLRDINLNLADNE